MSLSSTSTIKSQLKTALGPKAPGYFDIFQQFVAGQISRTEFDDSIRQYLDAPSLVQLHNSLIISLFDFSSHRRPPTPPPDVPKAPPRKRRRTLPYQGPDDNDGTLRSARLKRWAVSVGKRERDRLKTLPANGERPRPRPDTDEIACERGVILLPEKGEPSGSRLPLQLASVTRSLTLQHVVDKINLICAQQNINIPVRTAASLVLLATQTHLKQLVTQAIALSSASHAITSITPSTHTHPTTHLRRSTFSTLFTLSPSLLPYDSAAARQLTLGDSDYYQNDDEDVALLKDREVRDQRWQMIALLGERSTVKETLRTMR